MLALLEAKEVLSSYQMTGNKLHRSKAMGHTAIQQAVDPMCWTA
jgi:hypothetical protein